MAFTNDDILTLARAGFTAEQIAALNAVKTPAQAPAQAPVQAPAQAPVQAPVQAPAPAPVQAQAPAMVPGMPIMATPAANPVQIPEQAAASTNEILEAINGLTATMQSGFLQGASQPTPQTAETILAEIINPPSKSK